MSETVATKVPKQQFVQSSLNIIFSKYQGIRAVSSKLAEALASKYFPVQELNFADEQDPELPRLFFSSQHGFSQLVFSQTSVTMNVVYSPEWQSDIAFGEAYLLERADLLFDALEAVEAKPLYGGLTTIARVAVSDESSMLSKLAELHRGNIPAEHPHEIICRISSVRENRYFSNLTIRNFRTWSVPPFQQGTLRLSQRNATEIGIEVQVDFNDRYAFNEQDNYHTDRSAAASIITTSIDELRITVGNMEQEQW